MFTDWFGRGGRVLHARVSVPHNRGDDFGPLWRDLGVLSRRLVTSPELGAVMAPDGWVRRAHVVLGDHGWHPHHHLMVLLPPADRVTDQTLRDLEMSWRGKLGEIKARAGRRSGLFARVVESVAEALYAWRSGAPPTASTWGQDPWWESGSDWGHGDDDDNGWGSTSVWDVASAALGGDRQAWRRWEELGLGLRGKRVVQPSRLVRDIAARYTPVVTAGFDGPPPKPVLLVATTLWERARWFDCCDAGLKLAREAGVPALASWWGDQLGHPVEIAAVGGVPALWLVGRQPAADDLIAFTEEGALP